MIFLKQNFLPKFKQNAISKFFCFNKRKLETLERLGNLGEETGYSQKKDKTIRDLLSSYSLRKQSCKQAR